MEAKREERRLKREGVKRLYDMFPDSNDMFFFIAGYTSGGAPYGLTWDEMGVEPYENPFETADESDD